ncbi:MAG TPA: hypothetical protein VKB19_15200 [Pedobacter sp.]|nr:hypothetical protein [Pedobacter sp.]
MTTDTAFLKLKDLDINLVKYSFGKPRINFLTIHDDEDTGVKAAFEYIMFSGGSIIDCQYGGTRNYKFSHQGTNFQTDPNSIYSYEGVVVGLEKYKNIDSDDVIRQLQETSKMILNYYNAKKHGYMFTLHNNADGGFGILSYLEGNALEQTADSVYVNPEMDPDDLVLVTDISLFSNFKKQNVNVILQSDVGPEDGSLSVYAMYNKIPYINVEVQHGHQYEHLRLIEIAIKVLYETYPYLKEKAAE